MGTVMMGIGQMLVLQGCKGKAAKGPRDGASEMFGGYVTVCHIHVCFEVAVDRPHATNEESDHPSDESLRK